MQMYRTGTVYRACHIWGRYRVCRHRWNIQVDLALSNILQCIFYGSVTYSCCIAYYQCLTDYHTRLEAGELLCKNICKNIILIHSSQVATACSNDCGAAACPKSSSPLTSRSSDRSRSK